MDLLFIDTLIYRLLGRDFFFRGGKTMPPSLVPEWIHLFSATSGSHLFRPATAAGAVCVGGLARPSPSSCPCPAPAPASGKGLGQTPAWPLRAGSAVPGVRPWHSAAAAAALSPGVLPFSRWWALISSNLINRRAFAELVLRCNLAVTKCGGSTGSSPFMKGGRKGIAR